MCGRFALTITGAPLAEMLRVPEASLPAAPRFNIAPSQPCHAAVANGDRRELVVGSWGLPGGRGLHINARSETVAGTPRFRQLFARSETRCLIPADGYYEWRREGRIRQPYHFTLPGRGPFCFAGLLEEAPDRDRSLLILTTAANASCRNVHHRMPLILPVERWQTWLCGDVDGALRTIETAIAPDLESRPVSQRVNDVAFDDPDCVREGHTQSVLFDL